MNINVKAIGESFIAGLAYLPETLELILIPLLIGGVLGILIALIRVYKIPVLSQIFAAFVTIYQGIPVPVALLIYNLIYLMKCDEILEFFHSTKNIADIDSIFVGLFTMSLFAICCISEVFRGAFLSIDKGQREAGYVVGMTEIQTIRRILLPQVIPVAIPALVNTTVGLIKATSIVYTIGVAEVLSGALEPSSRKYTFFEGYLAAAITYWILTVAVEILSKLLERKTGKFRR